jgi:pyrroline-5-carboxylate reductase
MQGMTFRLPAGEVERKCQQLPVPRGVGSAGRGSTAFCLSGFWHACYNAVMAAKLTIGFLGAGRMATALALGFLKARIVRPGQVFASDLLPAARKSFGAATGARICGSNLEVLRSASVIVLAVKPQQADEVLAEIQPIFTPRHLLISIAAGLRLARLQSALPARARVIRVMPNTPALVGASASGFARGSNATRSDAALAQRLLESVGVAAEVKESLLDAVTGLSGSGPAYVYQFIEAMSDGGVASGLPRALATKLAAQTVLGAARMVLETGEHPGVLKDAVASPGGTTIEGIHEIEKGNLRGAVMNAVRAATAKAIKLGQGG